MAKAQMHLRKARAKSSFPIWENIQMFPLLMMQSRFELIQVLKTDISKEIKARPTDQQRHNEGTHTQTDEERRRLGKNIKEGGPNVPRSRIELESQPRLTRAILPACTGFTDCRLYRVFQNYCY